jgi:hypothetical protein
MDYKRLEEYKEVQRLIKRCLPTPVDPDGWLYQVYMGDNFNFMDQNAGYTHRQSYVAYGIAVEVAKVIVDRCLPDSAAGSTNLYAGFAQYGDMPYITPAAPDGVADFCGLDYAKARSHMLENL